MQRTKTLSFKLIVLLLIACLIIPLLPDIAVKADNEQIYVTGFEDDVTTGWYRPWNGEFSVTGEKAYWGNKSLKFTGRQNSWDSPAINLYNMIKQNGAGTYMVQMSVLVDDLVEGGEYGHLLIRGNQANSFITSRGNGNYYYKLTSTVKFVENEWYHFTGSFVVTNSDISATSGLFNLCFDFITPTANQNIYIDNVRVVKMDPLQVIPTAETLYVGDRLILDVNRYNYTTYTSSDPSVATVDSNGIVLAIASGRTTITVNYNNIETAECVVDVRSVENGIYYLQNAWQYSGYLQASDNTSDIVNASLYIGRDHQKWRIEYVDAGYYRIISGESYCALTVENISSANSNIKQSQYREGATSQLWRIDELNNGNYKITPRSAEGTDLCLAASSMLDSLEGYQGDVSQLSYNDIDAIQAEWVIHQLKEKAIVIVPGILGSSLQETDGTDVWLHLLSSNYNKMELTENGESVYDVVSVNKDNYGANNTYKALYNRLRESYSDDFEIIFFDYDFRLSNTIAANRLARETQYYDEIVLVAHSMGGLVASKYLVNDQRHREKTAAFISIGTPYLGAAKCIDTIETGKMISLTGYDHFLFNGVVERLSKNSYSAYQLLPTINYYSYTSSYPITVNGIPYQNAYEKLKNTDWGKKSDDQSKPMFDAAENFYSSLFENGQHIINNTDVPIYTIASIGIDTIATVNLDSNYEIDSLTYSNSGDGTVLKISAGHGEPTNICTSNIEHVDMVSSQEVLLKVTEIISTETGVAVNISETAVETAEIATFDNSTNIVELSGDSVRVNDRGWIVGMDNRRINICSDSEGVLIYNGEATTECAEKVYSAGGLLLGSVWQLGNAGRKMYALYNGEYVVTHSANLKIEYMNNGYYDKITEASDISGNMQISVGDYNSKEVVVQQKTETVNNDNVVVFYTYTPEELAQLNS